MGFAAGGEGGATSSEIPGPDETEEANEDESVVHQCASVGDAEVLFKFNFLWLSGGLKRRDVVVLFCNFVQIPFTCSEFLLLLV
uniref:Ankyrin-repeat protein HBP1 n=1 Tax=Solanum tuberosum TaxID=4113 RepID=M1C701_SOLTU